MSGVSARRAAGAVALAAAAATAQAPGSWTWRDVPDAAAVAVGVAWAQGFDDAPPGGAVARALAECRLDRARAAVSGLSASGLLASGVFVAGDVAVVHGVFRPGEAAAGAAFVAALLDDGRAIGDDALALAVARAALAADDHEHIFPGGVLETRLRAACGVRPRPPQGSAAVVARLGPADVRGQLAAPVAAWGAALGALTPAWREGLAALPLPRPPAVAAATAAAAVLGPASGPGAGALPAEPHPRIDAPFVAAAGPVPDGDRAAFALAVEVARSRAEQRFRRRGTEAMARAPLVAWSWLAAEPLLRFHRRSEDPLPLLPGERAEASAADAAAAAQAELAAFLDDLRARPPAAAELDAARHRLLGELGLLPVEAGGLAAALLPGRLLVLLLAERRGIDGSRLQAVTPAAAHAALAAALVADRVRWHALLPLARPDRGFRRR